MSCLQTQNRHRFPSERETVTDKQPSVQGSVEQVNIASHTLVSRVDVDLPAVADEIRGCVDFVVPADTCSGEETRCHSSQYVKRVEV